MCVCENVRSKNGFLITMKSYTDPETLLSSLKGEVGEYGRLLFDIFRFCKSSVERPKNYSARGKKTRCETCEFLVETKNSPET
uniref:Uncharacterized protein n=1 Tax=Seriola dumerili TaxID=41447 RepID=A0A3B4UUH1_SERDU